jgi:hypothetical protein
VQDVLGGDGAGDVGHHGAHERFEAAVRLGRRLQVAGVHGIHHLTVGRRGDVRGDADQARRTDRQVGQHVDVVAGEVHQVGVVEHAADLGEVALGILDRQDVRMLGGPQNGLVLDRDAGAARDVVEDDRQVRGVGDEPEVGEHAGLGGLVVIRRDDHDRVGAGLLAGLVELHRVGGLVGAAAGDDLRPAGRDGLADLDELELLRVGERAGLAGGGGDDDAVGAGVDDVVDVLLDSWPVHLAVGGERGDQGDQHLAERILTSTHDLQGIAPAPSPAAGRRHPGLPRPTPFRLPPSRCPRLGHLVSVNPVSANPVSANPPRFNPVSRKTCHRHPRLWAGAHLGDRFSLKRG